MAQIKNFGLIGVGGGVQFGKGGAQLVSAAGMFAAKSADLSTLVRVGVADPISLTDAVTLQFLNGKVAAINGTVAAVQTELNNTIAGAGLAANTGAYVPSASGSYIGSATSLAGADLLLDTALSSTGSLLTNVIAASGLTASGSFLPVAGTYAAAGTSIASAITAVDTGIVAVRTVQITMKNTIGLNPDGSLTALTGSYVGGLTSVVGAIEALDSSLTSVSQVADTASQLSSRLTTDEAAIASNGSMISALQTRATTDENAIAANGSLITALQSATSANGTLAASNASAITALQNRATADEMNITAVTATAASNGSQIATLVTRANTDEANAAAMWATFLKRDGSIAMTGAFNAGGFLINNVASPVAATDAVNLGTVQTLIGNLGSAFSYVGTVTAGTQAAPFNLSTLTGTNNQPLAAGDYYKVTTAGYVSPDGAAGDEFQVYANDGLIYNTTGGWDRIAHVDTVINGTSGLVDVSGTVDSGFTITIDPAFTGQVSTIASKQTTDEANIATNTANIASNLTAIGAETTRATMAEGALTTNLSAEVTRATGSEGSLNTAILAAGSQIAAVQGSLSASIVAEGTRAMAAETANTTAITSEVSRATAAEGSIVASVTAETTRATASEGSLRASVIAEGTRAMAAEAAQLGYIGNIETAVGLSASGTFLPFTTTNYLNSATSVANSLTRLDSTVGSLSMALASTMAYEIVSTSGSSTVAVTDAQGVTVTLASKVVGTITSSGSATAAFSISTASPGYVAIGATTASGNANIGLVPQGTGSVVVGQGAPGMIRGASGQTLTVSGGDAAAGTAAGSLILRAGAGSPDGIVSLVDGNNGSIATFTGVAGATASLAVTNGSSSVTLAATGGTADLVLAPGGTGNVSVSGARVLNVAAPVQPTDAANMSYVTTSISTALAANDSGNVDALVATFSEVSGTVAVGLPISGIAIRVRVLITAAFASGTTISVGSTANVSELMDQTQIDQASVGYYISDVDMSYTGKQIVVSVAASASGAGTAQVIVDYIHA